MNNVFSGSSLRLARSALNFSLSDVGQAVGKSKQYIQRLESERDFPTPELVGGLAQFLQVEEEFFFAPLGLQVADDCFHFRKLIGTKMADKQAAIAKGEIFRRVISFVDSKLRLPAYDFPVHDISTPEAAERAAERCRAHWGLGLGPISNMIRVVENAGAVVTSFEQTGKDIDALSIATSRPIVVMNRNEVSACRARFGHAHEVAHFVGHEGRQTGDKGSEAEANRFAGAFLMPRSSFAREFPALRGGTQINWRALTELKFRWRVSKAAMLYRARQLALLSEDQYRRAIIGHLYSKGQRSVEFEDADIPHEEPELFVKALSVMNQQLGIEIDEVARAVHIRKPMLTRVAPQIAELEAQITPVETKTSIVSLSDYRRKVTSH